MTNLDQTFKNCTALTKVNIPGRVTSLYGTFENCTSLLSVKISGSVTSIGDRAFKRAGIKTMIIPNNVTSIGTEAFQYSGLRSITLGDNVTSISSRAFSYCRSLSSVDGYIRNSIGENVFEGCPSSISIKIAIGKIKEGEFQYFNGSVTFAPSVREIEKNAFGDVSITIEGSFLPRIISPVPYYGAKGSFGSVRGIFIKDDDLRQRVHGWSETEWNSSSWSYYKNKM